MKKSTYKRRSQTVSTVRKSQAMIAARLRAQELRPAQLRPPRRRLDPMPAQDRPDRARRKPDPEPDQFAMDAPVAPSRILPREPQHQF
jgi:hypothetical protein